MKRGLKHWKDRLVVAWFVYTMTKATFAQAVTEGDPDGLWYLAPGVIAAYFWALGNTDGSGFPRWVAYLSNKKAAMLSRAGRR